MSAEQTIADAMRVQNFLKDDAVRGAIERLEKRYIEQMIAAETGEARAKAQGKIHAVRGFADELAAIISSGEQEVLTAHRKGLLQQQPVRPQ